MPDAESGLCVPRNALLAAAAADRDIMARFYEQILCAFVVIRAMTRIEPPVSAIQFGVLISAEMVTAMWTNVPVAWLADRTRRNGTGRKAGLPNA